MLKTDLRNRGVLLLTCIIGFATLLLVVTGCVKPDVFRFRGKNSPITVADGSMEVRTNAHRSSNGNTLTISGKHACSILIGGNGSFPVKGLNWSITSVDGTGFVQTSDMGKTIVAQGPNRSDLDDGPGSTFTSRFAPPSFSINGVTQPLNCPPDTLPRCKVRIDYYPECP